MSSQLERESLLLCPHRSSRSPSLRVHNSYLNIYAEWLHSSLDAIARESWQEKIELHIAMFDVCKEPGYPDEEELKDGLWDAIIITGSSEPGAILEVCRTLK